MVCAIKYFHAQDEKSSFVHLLMKGGLSIGFACWTNNTYCRGKSVDLKYNFYMGLSSVCYTTELNCILYTAIHTWSFPSMSSQISGVKISAFIDRRFLRNACAWRHNSTHLIFWLSILSWLTSLFFNSMIYNRELWKKTPKGWFSSPFNVLKTKMGLVTAICIHKVQSLA